MGKRERYTQPKYRETTILVQLGDNPPKFADIARRKVTTPPVAGDVVHLRDKDISGAPFVRCQIITIEPDGLYRVRLAPEPTEKTTHTQRKRRVAQVVKAMVNGSAEITMQLARVRPKIGSFVDARPKFSHCPIPKKWKSYRVTAVDELAGCTCYILAST